MDKLSSIYDLELFTLNTNIDHNFSPVGQSHMQIHSRYFPRIVLGKWKSSNWKMKSRQVFLFFYSNVVRLNRHFENLQTHLLHELEFFFNVIGATETKLINFNFYTCNANIPGYVFQCAPTSLECWVVHWRDIKLLCFRKDLEWSLLVAVDWDFFYQKEKRYLLHLIQAV